MRVEAIVYQDDNEDCRYPARDLGHSSGHCCWSFRLGRSEHTTETMSNTSALWAPVLLM
jgi:hypothetical protein